MLEANPQTVSLVITIVALGLTIFFAVYYVRTKKLLDEVWAVDTYDARELGRMCTEGFNAMVEVEGEVICENTMDSPAAGIPCCWSRTRVSRERRNRKGGTHWDNEMDLKLYVPFDVKDQTGSVTVIAENPDIDSITACDRVTMQREPWFECVGFSDTGRYKITEEVFLAGGYAFVHGEAKCIDGVVIVGPPEEGYLDPASRFFLISRLTQPALVGQRGITTTVCFWGAIVGFLAFVGAAISLWINLTNGASFGQ